jgi:hypothetical protein
MSMAFLQPSVNQIVCLSNADLTALTSGTVYIPSVLNPRVSSTAQGKLLILHSPRPTIFACMLLYITRWWRFSSKTQQKIHISTTARETQYSILTFQFFAACVSCLSLLKSFLGQRFLCQPDDGGATSL